MRRIAFLTLFLAGIITSLMIGILIRMLRGGTQALHERPRLRYASLAAGVVLAAIAFLRDR
jgi:hypothetical protein